MSLKLLDRFYQAILSNNENEFLNIVSKLKSSDFDRRNPFVDAVDTGKVKILEKLYEHFPELINSKDDRKIRPFQRAIHKQHLDAAVFIFKKRQPQKSNYTEMANQLLNKAIIDNRMDIVVFIMKYADVNNFSSGGITPLHHAVLVNNVPIINLLISNGANAFYCNEYGENPLHFAVRCGSTLAAQSLIDIIPTEYIDQTDMNEDTALHQAVLKENVDVIRELLKKGADMYLRNNAQKSPVDMLSAFTNAEVVRLFKTKDKSKFFTFSAKLLRRIFKTSSSVFESDSNEMKRKSAFVEKENKFDQKEFKTVPFMRFKTRL